MINIKFKKLNENAVIPTYAHKGDMGMDFTAIGVEYDEEKDVYIYHTGLACQTDFNIGQFIFCRSSNCKTECYLTNHVGVVDSAIYRGEIQFRFKLRDSTETMASKFALEACVKNGVFDKQLYIAAKNAFLMRVKNLEFAPYKVGDKIGQMFMVRYEDVSVEETEELNETERGEGGFGSTDKLKTKKNVTRKRKTSV